MAGGSYRGPVAVRRQRRTIRLVQALLILIAAGLLMFAGYSMGRADGIDEARERSGLEPARGPSAAQTIVLAILGLGAAAAAVGLQTEGGVRLLTPQRLRELEAGEGPEPLDEEPEAAERDVRQA